MKDQKEINKRQKEFYQSFKKNFATRLWFSLRNGILTKFRKSVGIESVVVKQHYTWIGDVKGKKVLDLGCYKGNSLSMYLAENASEYYGIDLSETAISHLEKRLRNIPTAHALAIDFLSEEFKESEFDLIYAYAVLHHFRDVDRLIEVLNDKLSKNGEIVCYDPTTTSKSIWFLRKLYRPFQSDKDWEWPFNEKTISKFEKAFDIKDRRGTLGKSKWFILLNFLPCSDEWKTQIGKKWHDEDWEKSQKSRGRFLRCMQVSMYMKKKDLV
jgi:2-polyprenyl-3-methyl-5-hydroxy-6-metoxy-1,4-benzoquinol methylase